MEITVIKGEKNTFIATVKLTKAEVAERISEAVEHESQNVEVKGFRKGKAPLELVKKQIDFAHLRSHVLNHLIPEIYSKIVKENKIAPIINPRVEIIAFAEDQEAELKITLVEKPTIKIGDYKKGLEEKIRQKAKSPVTKAKEAKSTETSQSKDMHSDSQSEEQAPKSPANNDSDKSAKDEVIELLNDEIVDVIVANSTVELPDLLIEEETNRMVSGLVDQITKLGLNLEQYLTSIKKSPEDVRSEYKKIAEQTLHADFAITQIAIDNSYQVDDTEIKATIEAVSDEKTREQLAKPEQTIYIRAILTKAKTLNKLAEYARECYNKNSDTKSN